jgi:hypothetical protein
MEQKAGDTSSYTGIIPRCPEITYRLMPSREQTLIGIFATDTCSQQPIECSILASWDIDNGEGLSAEHAGAAPA